MNIRSIYRIALLNGLLIVLNNFCTAQSGKNQANDGVQTPKKIQERLKSWLDSPTSRFKKLNTVVEYSEVQDGAKGGIEFDIVITNQDDVDVEFTNPLDFNIVQLSDDKNRHLILPCWESRLGRERWSKKKSNELDLPFQLVSTTVNDKQLSEQEIKARALLLPAKSSLRFSIKVNKVGKNTFDPKANPTSSPNVCASPEDIADLPYGNYRLQICINFMGWKQSDVQSIVCSKSLDIELKGKR